MNLDGYTQKSLHSLKSKLHFVWLGHRFVFSLDASEFLLWPIVLWLLLIANGNYCFAFLTSKHTERERDTQIEHTENQIMIARSARAYTIYTVPSTQSTILTWQWLLQIQFRNFPLLARAFCFPLAHRTAPVRACFDSVHVLALTKINDWLLLDTNNDFSMFFIQRIFARFRWTSLVWLIFEKKLFRICVHRHCGRWCCRRTHTPFCIKNSLCSVWIHACSVRSPTIHVLSSIVCARTRALSWIYCWCMIPKTVSLSQKFAQILVDFPNHLKR